MNEAKTHQLNEENKIQEIILFLNRQAGTRILRSNLDMENKDATLNELRGISKAGYTSASDAGSAIGNVLARAGFSLPIDELIKKKEALLK